MNERELQYNAAGERIVSLAERIQKASDEELPALEQEFRDAQAEFERCKKNLELAREAAGYREFRPEPVSNPNAIGLEGRDLQRYSLVRAIRALITGDWREAGLEREASEAVAKQLGRTPQGFFVPLEVQRQRALTSGDATHAGDVIATDLLAGSFIELLRNRMVVRRAGATVLGGLVGNVAIPRQTGAATGYWVAANNNSAITAESNLTVDQVTLTPHVYGAYTDIGRTLILQASLDVEMLVRNDLAQVCALGLDLAALSGSGASNQPTGIASTTGIGSVVCGDPDGAAPTWSDIVELETAIAQANADVDNMAYIMNARSRCYLKSNPKVASTPVMMWNDAAPDAPVNGYRAFVSNQVRSNLTKGAGTGLSEIFFGNWADLLIGQWGTLDIIADPYTGATAGTVRVIALQDVDIAVRHPESFARIADADV